MQAETAPALLHDIPHYNVALGSGTTSTARNTTADSPIAAIKTGPYLRKPAPASTYLVSPPQLQRTITTMNRNELKQ